MSSSIVKKALEITLADEEGLGLGSVNNKSSKRNKQIKKDKLIRKKKKLQSPENILKQNLKILKTLDAISSYHRQPSTSSTFTANSSNPNLKSKPELPKAPAEILCNNTQGEKKSKKKRNKKNKKSTSDSVFTEEDFAKFESEYFVAD